MWNEESVMQVGATLAHQLDCQPAERLSRARHHPHVPTAPLAVDDNLSLFAHLSSRTTCHLLLQLLQPVAAKCSVAHDLAVLCWSLPTFLQLHCIQVCSRACLLHTGVFAQVCHKYPMYMHYCAIPQLPGIASIMCQFEGTSYHTILYNCFWKCHNILTIALWWLSVVE